MSLLEINVKAKPLSVAAKPGDGVFNSVLTPFVVGKKYVFKNGTIGTCITLNPEIRIAHLNGYEYRYNSNGIFCGIVNTEYVWNVAREWISAEHDAWLEGKKIEGKMGKGTWFTFPRLLAYAPVQISAVEEMWFKNKDGSRQLRIAP